MRPHSNRNLYLYRLPIVSTRSGRGGRVSDGRFSTITTPVLSCCLPIVEWAPSRKELSPATIGGPTESFLYKAAQGSHR